MERKCHNALHRGRERTVARNIYYASALVCILGCSIKCTAAKEGRNCSHWYVLTELVFYEKNNKMQEN